MSGTNVSGRNSYSFLRTDFFRLFVSKNWFKNWFISKQLLHLQRYYVFQNVQHHLLNCHQILIWFSVFISMSVKKKDCKSSSFCFINLILLSEHRNNVSVQETYLLLFNIWSEGVYWGSVRQSNIITLIKSN